MNATPTGPFPTEIVEDTGILEDSPLLKRMIRNRTADKLELSNKINLEVRPASYRNLRGPSYIAVAADEASFWATSTDYDNPDVEVAGRRSPWLADVTRTAGNRVERLCAIWRGMGRYDLWKQHKSEIYRDPMLPLINSKHITLPRNDRLINQACTLERSVKRSGRDEITHPTHGHDDVINAVAGAAAVVLRSALVEQHVPFVLPYIWSKTSGVISDPCPGTASRSATAAFYAYGGSRDPFAREW